MKALIKGDDASQCGLTDWFCNVDGAHGSFLQTRPSRTMAVFIASRHAAKIPTGHLCAILGRLNCNAFWQRHVWFDKSRDCEPTLFDESSASQSGGDTKIVSTSNDDIEYMRKCVPCQQNRKRHAVDDIGTGIPR